MGIKTPKLLMLGLVRFLAVIIITIMGACLLLKYHQEILNLLWARPEGRWFHALWHIASWFLSLLLLALNAFISYLVSQVLFSVIIMDYMSRITEQIISGQKKEPAKQSIGRQFLFLVSQEFPRAVLPVLLSLIIMVLGWLTPFGPLVTIISPGVAVVFIAWDNTDLTPARRREPFKTRFAGLLKTLPFHLGFGLPFLLPILNLLFLSFAPVGATLYYIRKN